MLMSEPAQGVGCGAFLLDAELLQEAQNAGWHRPRSNLALMLSFTRAFAGMQWWSSNAGLIVACPTWNTGADEYRSGTAWDDLPDDIKGTDLAGKPVAAFGCGDSQGDGDYFSDGIEELHANCEAAVVKMVGSADAGAYQHAEAKSTRGFFDWLLPLFLHGKTNVFE